MRNHPAGMHWYMHLKEKYPDLHQRAENLNLRDSFEMKIINAEQFDSEWREIRSHPWALGNLDSMKKLDPHLAERAEELNRMDGFEMHNHQK
jgi:hypothetical protein